MIIIQRRGPKVKGFFGRFRLIFPPPPRFSEKNHLLFKKRREAEKYLSRKNT
jgi:hypothetical protein